MVMTARGGDAALHVRLPALWRAIEDAHYSYLETDDSPEKLIQRKKLEGYIMEYLSIVPHECKFGLPETAKVFQRTITESDFSAYRAGLGWAALARYAGNLLSQPWRKEYKTIRLYCGYFKHEVEANMVGAEGLLQAMGYKPVGGGRLQLVAPACPDMVAAISRDAIIAHVECQIMSLIWEAVWGGGGRVSWGGVARERARHAAPPAAAAARLAAPHLHGTEIYSNVPPTISHQDHVDSRTHIPCNHYPESPEDPIVPMIHPYMVPPMAPMYDQCTPVMPYGVPYYYPAPYMMPAPVAYAPIKQATTIPVNGYPPVPQYRYPTVPTAQLIELDSPSTYENGRYDHKRSSRQLESSRRNSTSKSGFSDVSLPSLPRSDTQPALSKAREDGMGTYESWDYVFRNLSSKDRNERSRASPSLDRDSRTLDRLDREERRSKYQPTTLDLEDGLQALNFDRSHDDEVYRTAKVNENLMRLKQEQEQKKARHLAKKQALEAKKRQIVEPVENVPADALITSKIAADKIRLLTKKDVKDRKEVIRQQSSVSSVNGSASTSELKKVKKSIKSVSSEIEKPKMVENGHSSKTPIDGTSQPAPHFDLKTHLVVSLDESDSVVRRSPPRQNGDARPNESKWQCSTCTYLNKTSQSACEMCGKSKRAGSEIQPLTSGGRECPTCTLVNDRTAKVCDACGTSLEHCPTYI